MVQVYLSCDVESAAHCVYEEIVSGSISGECIANYTLDGKGSKCTVMVFEKHFYRSGNRASLTVTVDSIAGNGRTRMTAVGSGGGQGIFFSFDWGAAGSFEESARRAVAPYICQ